MLRPFCISLTLLALTACATPQQRCISDASATMRKAERNATRIEGNIARGYAIHRQTIRVPTAEICTNPDGSTYTCMDYDHQVIETPVAIDIAQERRKLAELQKIIAQERPKVVSATQSCIAQFPE
ncbi:hypothetical protein SAMN04488527_101457 [Aliiroseovarius crassostreae]|uniref:Excinuclease ABC subunit B n=1 Tax=Aliiroseovarius crassostreae TaxID=154981 RepID=A0A0P7J7L3_9RHOB|nr:hypothetical protein [Aliiroseovarius crassostreae]KPN64426.1 hypothetical protein AKJ29_17590 [Aliiroseovarius crassostreae]SFU34715.1 hypothetical protein SAMN04488527_101457 [Aliiroseovarius crassostreae]